MAKAKTFNARDILAMTPDQLWSIPDGVVTVVFDDGPLRTTARRTIFSAYLWTFHRLYEKTPLLKEHHIGDQRLGKRTHPDTLGRCLFAAYDAYEGRLELNDLTRLAYEATNDLYNDMTYRLEPYVSSVSILDFVEVMDDPEVKKANTNVRPNEGSITQTYGIIEDRLKTKGVLVGNPVADAAKSGLISTGQILQCVGPRGYLTDIDSTIFPRPILNGYVEGFDKLYDSMIESRSAAKATSFNKDYVSDAEYFNRKMQLISETFRRVHGVAEVADGIVLKRSRDRRLVDCGSVAYRSLRLRPSDLKGLAGKYYLTEDNKLAAIRSDDRHLIGRSLKIRSVFDCLLKDREGVCATCFGELALSVPGVTNLGHLCATQLCEKVSQAVLSTKHLDQSSTVDQLPLSEYEQRFLRLGADPNHIGLSPKLNKVPVKLVISSDEAHNLSEVQYADNVEELPLSRISELTDIMLVVGEGKKEVQESLSVSIGSRKSSMSYKLLEYIKRVGWSLTPRGDYIIDLKDWPREDALFVLALKHLNMIDFMKSIERTIKSTEKKKGVKTLSDFEDPWLALMELYELVSSKLSVNIAHLEILTLAIMTVGNNDYNVPLGREEGTFRPYEEIMSNRSLAPRLAYRSQHPSIYSPRSYVYTNRPSHPLDAIFSE